MMRPHFVLELVGLVFIVYRDGQYRSFREIKSVGLVDFREPFFFRELRWHIVYVLHTNGSSARTCAKTIIVQKINSRKCSAEHVALIRDVICTYVY